MLFLRIGAIAASVALFLATSAPRASADPATRASPQNESICTVTAPAATPTSVDGAAVPIEDNNDLRFMIENHGLAHMTDAIVSVLRQGLSEEALQMMNTTAPIHPGGAPLPTFAPPLPASPAVAPAKWTESPRANNPNFNCAKAFAAYAIYSWWSTGICALFAVGSTPLGGQVCSLIAWGGGAAVPWNNVCEMHSMTTPHYARSAGHRIFPSAGIRKERVTREVELFS